MFTESTTTLIAELENIEMTSSCDTEKALQESERLRMHSSLYTCIFPTGKDGLTIDGLDKKEYDAERTLWSAFPLQRVSLIRAQQARDKNSHLILSIRRMPILCSKKSMIQIDKDKLYSMALSDLKTASDPVVTYEVDGYFDTDIGDTVRMQDQEWTPVLYLQARVSEQVRSLTDPKTVGSVVEELTSEISEQCR